MRSPEPDVPARVRPRRRGPFVALMWVELRRCFPPVRNGLVLAGVGTVLLLLSGTERRDLLAFPSGAVGISFMLSVGAAGLRDRMDRGLEFVQSLPVEPGLAAGARVGAIGVLCALAAILATAALRIAGVPTVPGWTPYAWYAASALTAWISFIAVGTLAAGILLRFTQARLRMLPATFGILAILGVLVPEGTWLDPALVRRAIAAPWFPAALGVAVWGAALAGTWLGHHLLTSAIRDFRPTRDRIEW